MDSANRLSSVESIGNVPPAQSVAPMACATNKLSSVTRILTVIWAPSAEETAYATKQRHVDGISIAPPAGSVVVTVSVTFSLTVIQFTRVEVH